MCEGRKASATFQFVYVLERKPCGSLSNFILICPSPVPLNPNP
jgi:hypothetical protein